MDWYLGLTLGQKIVVGIAVVILVFVSVYLSSIVILLAAGAGPEDYPPQEEGGTPAPASLQPGGSASVSAKPDYALTVEEARWEGERAVVEGTWKGDLSSVHCDLLEGGRAGRAIDWWDRSVAAKMSFSEGTFSQEFVRARGELDDRIDPEDEYWVTCCYAQPSGGHNVRTSARAPERSREGPARRERIRRSKRANNEAETLPERCIRLPNRRGKGARKGRSNPTTGRSPSGRLPQLAPGSQFWSMLIRQMG